LTPHHAAPSQRHDVTSDWPYLISKFAECRSHRRRLTVGDSDTCCTAQHKCVIARRRELDYPCFFEGRCR
jgi:hypothetical protein